MSDFIEFSGYVFRKSELVFIEPIDKEYCRLVFKNGIELRISLVSKRINRNQKEVVNQFSVYDIYKQLD